MTVGRNLAISRARRRQTAERSLDRLPQPDGAAIAGDDRPRQRARPRPGRRPARGLATDRQAVVLAANGYRGREIAADLGRTELASRALLSCPWPPPGSTRAWILA